MIISELDERCLILESNTDNLQSTIDNEGEAHNRKDKLLEELKESNAHYEVSIDELKRSKK